MPVTGLDHVNIIAQDLAATVRFYSEVLGLEARNPPGGVNAANWLYDSQGSPIVHLGTAGEGHAAGAGADRATGAIHHLALACTDFDDTLARLASLALPHRVNAPPGRDFRQIFITDPDGVMLELNFRD